MIEVDISNVWGGIALPDLLAMEKDVFDTHRKLTADTYEEGENDEGQAAAVREDPEELLRIRKCAERIRSDSEICVVVGTGGSWLGARAAIELLQGVHRNLKRGKEDPQIFFTGNSLSTRQWNELMALLEGKDYSVIVISESGTTLESAIAFRGLRWQLERKYGTDEANGRIYVVTDPEQSALGQMAETAGWETFAFSGEAGNRDSVLSAAGLLPMAVAGIAVSEVLQGASEAKETYDLRSYENPVWLYAAVRNLLYRSGRKIELFASYEPGFRSFGSWWQYRFGTSGGDGDSSIFPAAAEFPADLYSMGQLILRGERNLFETLVRFEPSETEHIIGSDWQNLDELNYLEGKSLSFVEEQACFGTLDEHVDSGIPVLTMDCGTLNDRTVGELFYFLELASRISDGILGCAPRAGRGHEDCRQNLFRLLGKPGFEMGAD